VTRTGNDSNGSSHDRVPATNSGRGPTKLARGEWRVVIDLFGNETQPKRAIGSHQAATGGTDEWLTPPSLLASLGSFDLDPCAPIVRPWPTASRHFTIADDGLTHPWHGRVWLNPPYSQAGKWLNRLAEHGDGLALIFARTETRLWFTHVWPHASALLFLRGRLVFHRIDGRPAAANAGAPHVLIAYGAAEARRLASVDVPGKYVPLNLEASCG
jgi:hypothetical protein